MSKSSSFATVALLTKALGQLATTARTFQKVLQSFENESENLVEVVREVVQPTKPKNKRFECGPCNYTTNSPSDWRKHCRRDKHLKNTDRRKDERRFGECSKEYSRLIEKYGLGEEVSIYTKMAYCWLHPTYRQSTGHQAIVPTDDEALGNGSQVPVRRGVLHEGKQEPAEAAKVRDSPR